MYRSIASCVGSTPEREHVSHLVEICFRMAKVYLRRRAQAGRLDPNFFGISLDDLALDCVAELFERDEDGRFPQLVDYYSSLIEERPSDARLLGATRRLVFSKVSESLYRRYREADPTLHKLMRNLRYSVRTGDVGREERVRGRLWIVFDEVSSSDEALSRPIMSEELLQVRLSALVDGSTSLKETVAAVRRLLRMNPDYAPGFPLVGLATVIRNVYDVMADDPRPHATSLDELFRQELHEMLHASRERIDRSMRPKYVGKKLSPITFEAYISAAKDALCAEFVEPGAEDATHFDVLHPYLRRMTYEEFRRNHRGRFQYVVKKMRDDFLSTAEAHFV